MMSGYVIRLCALGRSPRVFVVSRLYPALWSGATVTMLLTVQFYVVVVAVATAIHHPVELPLAPILRRLVTARRVATAVAPFCGGNGSGEVHLGAAKRGSLMAPVTVTFASRLTSCV